MNQLKYDTSRLTRHTWLVFALFLVVFNSAPVKRFIRLHIAHNETALPYSLPAEFRSQQLKDCTLIERHDISFISETGAHQDIPNNDLLVPLVVSVAALLLAAPVARKITHAAERTLIADNVPVYLHHCRLQV